MFTYLPGLLSLGLGPESVVAIIESINSPNISIPEIGTEPTKGYLVGFATANGGYGIFCYLLFLQSNTPIIYISNPPEVSFDEYAGLEADAILFAESMGFMLDNMNFRAQPEETQLRLAEQLPFFRDQYPSGSDAPPAAVDPAQGNLHLVARLLASF